MALAATAFGAIAAQADDLVVKEHVAPGVVVKEKVGTPRSNVVIREHRPVVHERITTGSSDCSSKTISKTNENTDRTKVKTTTHC
jgi:hypothetical protein